MNSSVHERLLAGRYELQHAWVSEGSRRVWRAYDCLLSRPVVIKGAFARRSAPLAEALALEYRRMGTMPHPVIARAFDLGWAEKVPGERQSVPFIFFTQEWIPGSSLRELRNSLSVEEIGQCLTELLEVVAYLHARRWVSLDLKPAHLLRSESGWRLIDLDQVRIDDPLADVELAGTLPYLAPEVLAGRDIDARSDLYSVGALLYEALTGSPPGLEGKTIAEISAWLPDSPLPDFSEDIAQRAPRLVALSRTLLARSPNERPGSAEETLRIFEEKKATAWRSRAPLPDNKVVGREKVFEEINLLDGHALQHHGGGIEVVGAARSGRSRVLLEAATGWQSLGRPVLRIEGLQIPRRRLEGVTLIRRHLESLGGTCGSISNVAPSFDSGPSASSSGSLNELRETSVRRALSQLLEAGRQAAKCAEELIPIVIDDIDCLDELSRHVLRELRLHLPGSGLLLLSSERRSGVSGAEAQQDTPSTIWLAPLSSEDERSLAEDLLGPGSVHAEDIRHLHEVTEGLVGWVREALALRWRNPDFSFQDFTPASAEQILDNIFRDLPAALREVAAAASVFDGLFTIRQLNTVLERGLPKWGQGGAIEPAKIVQRLVRAGIFASRPDLEGAGLAFCFAHEPTRRALERSLSEETRARLHSCAAEALERYGAGDPDSRDGVLARHFIAAGQPDRARGPLHRAYSRARSQLWLDEAADYLRQLIGISAKDDPEWLELHVELGGVAYELGRFGEARRVFESGLEAEGSRAVGLEARCQAGLGRAMSALGEMGPARGKLEEALNRGVGVAPNERLVWWYALAWLSLSAHDTEGAHHALDGARREGVPPHSWRAVLYMRYEAWIGLEEGDVSDSLLARLKETLTLARDIEFVRGELILLNTLMQAYRSCGDLEHGREYAQAMVDRAHACFDLAWEATGSVNLGYILRAQGDLAGAFARFERAAEIQERVGNSGAEARSRLAAADILLERGHLERVDAMLGRISSLLASREADGMGARRWLELLELRLLVQRGKTEGLEDRIGGLEAELSEIPQPELRLAVLALRMELFHAQGQPRSVLKIYRSISEELHDMPHLPTWRRVHVFARRAHEALAPARGGKGEGSGSEEARGYTAGASGDSNVEDGYRGLVTPGTGAQGSVGSAQRNQTPTVWQGGAVESRLEWLERIRRLLELTGEDEFLAAELARQAGELLNGRGLVFIFDGSRPQVMSCHGMTEEQVDDVSRTIIERVRQERRSFACEDIMADREVRELRSLRMAGVRSVVCSPVVRDGVCLGVIYVDRPGASEMSTGDALAVLEKVASLAADLLGGLRRQTAGWGLEPDHFGLVGTSAPMLRLKERISEIVEARDPDLVVLLQGATGTGKSLIARKIHEYGVRQNGPFHTVDCAAIPEGLVEELMFGHKGGIFTGARHSRAGWFEQAENGTLFLDEIGEMPVEQQRRLLTTLGSRKFNRMGEVTERDLNVHLVCATNRDLRADVQAGRFREDLLRRIYVNVLEVPSLKERGPEDTMLLVRHYITEYLKRREVLSEDAPLVLLNAYLAPAAQDFLSRYDWPWNVGEVENLFRNEAVRRQLRSADQGRQRRLSLETVQEALGVKKGLGSRMMSRPVPAAVDGSSSLETSAKSSEVPADLRLPIDYPYASLQEVCENLKRSHVLRVYEACGRKLLPTAERMGASRDVIRRYVKGRG